MGKISRILLIVALIVGIIPTLAKPAAASSGAPAFGLSSNFEVEAEAPYSNPGYSLADAQGLPDGKTAVLMYNFNSFVYQLRIFAQDGSLISSTQVESLLDTRYNKTSVQMLALRDGNVLLTYYSNDTGSENHYIGTLPEPNGAKSGAFFIIVNERGQKVLGQTQINATAGPSLTRFFSMAELSGGNIAFSYQLNDNKSVVSRVFTKAGVAASNEILLVSANALMTHVAASDNDTYSVAYNQGSPSNTTWMRQFSSNGDALGVAQNLGAFDPYSFSLQSLSNGNILFDAYSNGSTTANIYSNSGQLQKTFTLNNAYFDSRNFATYRNAGAEGFVIGNADDAINSAYQNAYSGNPTDWSGSVGYYFDYYLNDGTFVARTLQPVDSGPAALIGYSEDDMDFMTANYYPTFRMVSGYDRGVGLITEYNPTSSSSAWRAKLYGMITSESTSNATINYSTEQLSGLMANAAYTINGAPVTTNATGEVAIDSSWFGTSLSLVKPGNGTTTTDSAAQTLAIPVRPSIPSGVDAMNETYPGANDGTLTGVTTAMEYKASAASTWSAISGTTVTGRAPAAYDVRLKATGTSFASLPTTATVASTPATPQSTPSAAINYTAEQLTGLTASAAYKINGAAISADGTGDIAIDSSWIGTSVSVVKAGNGTTTTDSGAQTLAIPTRPAVPTGVGATDEAYPGANNGKLTGVMAAMEYKASTASTWTMISGTTVTGLAPAMYDVRVRATGTSFASLSTTATVATTPTTPEATPSAAIDYRAEELSGLTANAAYKVNGTAVTADTAGKVAIDGSWIGTSASVVKAGNGTTTTDSAAQTLPILARPSAPSGVGATDEAYPGADNGTLTGVTAAMEYKASSDRVWTSISGTTVTGLAPATYDVRVTATGTAFASLPTTVTVATIPTTPESTPSAAIDFAAEQLNGLTADAAYIIDGAPVTATGKVTIDSGWIGTSLTIVKTGNGTTTTDSAAQTLAIPARPSVPSGIGATNEAYAGAGDGTLTGVTAAMEYKASTDSAWTSISGTEVTGLAPATYDVRMKATGTSFASLPTTATVSTIPPAPSATIDYAAEQLSGLTTNADYTINGKPATANAAGKIAIDSSWIGTSLSIVKAGNGTTTIDSAAQTLAIPARPATPSGVGATDEAYPGAGNGTLTGVTAAMEYKASADSAWTNISGTTATALAPATYDVRVKATGAAFASRPTTATVATIPATPEATPTAAIDFAIEQLGGLTASAAYTINGEAVTADTAGEIAIDSSWISTSLSIVKAGNGTTKTDSAAQTLAIPARPSTPSGVGATDETYLGAGDGTLTGLTAGLEYKASTASAWTSISGTEVTELAAATYDVRVKATGTAFASLPTTATVASTPATPEATPAATIDYATEQLRDLIANAGYKINGAAAVTADATGSIAINGSWIGTSLSVVKAGNGTTTTDSAAQTLAIPDRPAAPAVTADDGNNRIVDLDTTMEFSVDGAGYVKFDGTNAPNLNGAHSVIVRTAATGSQLAGDAITLSFSNPSSPAGSIVDPGTTGEPFLILVNGKAVSVGKVYTTEVNGKKQTRIVLDPDKLQQMLEAEGKHAVITIPITSVSSNIIVTELTGQMIEAMQKLDATLVLQTDKGSYALPSNQINIDSQFAGQPKLSDVAVSVTIAETSATVQQLIDGAASKNGFTIVAPPVEFTLTVTYGGKTVEISSFNAYVKRTIALPAGVDPKVVSTAIVVDPDGSVRQVPTRVQLIDGIYYAVINSMTNSTYAVVSHPTSFTDMAQHWAKDAVNDMGARFIVNGQSDSLFHPDADITRAEFAAIVVRGLGLKLGTGTGTFSDVAPGAWYQSAIQTAASYGLITGFEDGAFHPNAKITREQAMLIVARAMKLSGLAAKTGQVGAESVLQAFADKASVAAWAQNDVALVVQAGLVKGRDDKLEVNAYITRAEVATLIQRLLRQSDFI